MFCTALVIADNIPRDPDEGEEGIFSEELWSRESSASNNNKKRASYSFLSPLKVKNYSKLDLVIKILKFVNCVNLAVSTSVKDFSEFELTYN